jgi:hypothetical protein
MVAVVTHAVYCVVEGAAAALHFIYGLAVYLLLTFLNF